MPNVPKPPPRLCACFRKFCIRGNALMGARGPLPGHGGRPVAGSRRRTAPTGRVTMPSDLLPNVAAANYWRRHAPGLIADGRLTPLSVEPFAVLCRLAGEIEQHERTISDEGWILQAKNGYRMPHPAAALLKQARTLSLALAKEFGMTAASYARLPKHEEPAKDANPLTQFGITS